MFSTQKPTHRRRDDPERLPRWFYPINDDLTVSSNFQFEGNAGGEVHRRERPASLQVTFGSADSLLDRGWP